MHKRSTSELLSFDWKIEKTLFKLKKVKEDNTGMENQHIDRYSEGHLDYNEMLGMREPTLGDCWRPTMIENYLGIQHQSIDANNFELKLALISMVKQQQFGGNPLEDPNGHLLNFLELCGTIKMKGVDHDVIKLKLFPFSLR